MSNTSWNLFNFRLPLMRRLRDDGYEVIAVAPFDAYSNRLIEAGFRYITMPMNNKGTNPVEDFGLLVRLYKLFKYEVPDAVLTYTPKPNIYASMAGGLSRTDVIPNISGLGATFIRQTMLTRIMKALYKFALRFPPKVLFQNHDDLNFFIGLNLVSGGKAERIPGSGINTTDFFPQPVSREKDGSMVFLLVARLLWDKGVGEFVEAARMLQQKHSNVAFHLLGFLDVENPQAVPRAQVESWEAEGIITYLGVSDSVVDVMRRADCIVLPSYREGLPRTLIEAASLAKPVVTTDVPGCRDVVEDGITGLLCEVRNSIDLAEKMEYMIHMSIAERSAMGSLGRKKVINEFDENIVLDRYLQVVRELI